MENINIQDFIKKFNEIYDILYCNDDFVKYSKAIDAFDNKNFMKKYNNFLEKFVIERGDFVASDREAAAFILTINFFESI